MTFCDRKYRRYRRGVREVRAVIDIGKAQMVQLTYGDWELPIFCFFAVGYTTLKVWSG